MFKKNGFGMTTLMVFLCVCFLMSMSSCKRGTKVVDVGPLTKIKTETETETSTSSQTPRVGEGTIEVPDENLKTIHFDYDSYTIRNDAAVVLKSNIDWIKANMDKGEFLQIKIEGHCDERGTNKYNQVLGDRRANAVRNFMINEGVSGDILIPISYGEDKPLDTRNNEEAWAKNRRGEFKKVIDPEK